MKTFKQNYYKIIGGVGIVLSLLWIVFVNTQPYSDFKYYNDLAKQIANGGQWGDTYTSVGYSIVLGFIYKLLGSNLMVAKLFNVMLTALSYILLYKILYKINIKEGRRKCIFIFFVLFPNNIIYNSILGTEIIFTTILLFITLVYYSDLKYKYILIGVLTGINAMIKPFFIIFFLAIFIVEVITKNKFLSTIKNALIILVVSLVVVAPWCYRNTRLEGQLTFISNNNGIVMYINNNSQNNTGKWMPVAAIQNSIVNTKSYINANATEKNKMLNTVAKKWIKSHPIEFIKLGFLRLYNTYLVNYDVDYSFYGSGVSVTAQQLITSISCIVKSCIFIPGIIIILLLSIKVIYNLIRRKTMYSFNVYSIVLFYMISCVYFATEGQSRYSFPTIFIMIYFFSYIVEIIYGRFKVKNLGKVVMKG